MSENLRPKILRPKYYRPKILPVNVYFVITIRSDDAVMERSVLQTY